MRTVRILHISDLHISHDFEARNASRNYGLPFHFDPSQLKAAIGQLTKSKKDGFDGLLITGDLADSGEQEDLACVRQLLVQPPIPQSQITSPSIPSGLSLYKENIAVLPGNSDRFFSWSNGKPGCKNFDDSLTSLWTRGQNGVEPIKFNETLAILCIDCTLKKREHAYQHGPRRQGMVYPETVEALVRLTNKYHRTGFAVVWATHFPPHEPPDFHRQTGLTWGERKLCQGDKLVKAAQNCGVRHILCGHAHISACFNLDNNVWIHCAGTSACSGDRHHSTIHDLEFQCDGTSVQKVINKRLRWDGSTYVDWHWENVPEGVLVVS